MNGDLLTDCLTCQPQAKYSDSHWASDYSSRRFTNSGTGTSHSPSAAGSKRGSGSSTLGFGMFKSTIELAEVRSQGSTSSLLRFAYNSRYPRINLLYRAPLDMH